jgi:integrase
VQQVASYTIRGDVVMAQVRRKKDGRVVFSESKSFPTEAQARTWAEALEKKLDSDEGNAIVAVGDKTVGQLIEDHLEHLQSLRPLGRSAIQNHYYMATQFAKIKLREFTTKDILDFGKRRKDEGVSPATIKANLSVVSAAMNAAPYAHGLKVDLGPVTVGLNKLDEMGVTGKSKEIIRLVDQSEEDALLEQFRRRNLMPQTEIDMVLMYQWALALPRRVSELCRVTWADVNTKTRTLIIRDVKHPRKKIGNDQEVPLLPAAWELLERTPRTDARILPYNSESVSAAFERVRDDIAATGLPSISDLRFHDLRHTGITMLFWAGHPIEEVAVVSGHTNWVQLKRYTHIKPEDLHRRYDPKATKKRALRSIEALAPAAVQLPAPAPTPAPSPAPAPAAAPAAPAAQGETLSLF